jgi:hypothetical protein
MAVLDAPFMLAAALLLVAGVAKLHAPAPTVQALTDAGWPGSRGLVRGLGAVEVVVGLAALLLGGRPAAVALLVAYLGITAVAWRQRRTGADCGCFGASRAPVSGVHLGVNAAAVGVAGAGIGLPPAALPATLGGEPLVAATTIGVLAVSLVLLRAMLTHLPELTAARALHPEKGTA